MTPSILRLAPDRSVWRRTGPSGAGQAPLAPVRTATQKNKFYSPDWPDRRAGSTRSK